MNTVKKFVFPLIFLALFSFPSCQEPESVVESTNFELVKLGDGVYACIHKIGGKAICNVGIVDLGDGTIIFDTFLSPPVAEEIPILVEKLGLSPIKYVINSHFHNDHVRGNQAFNSEVQIIGTSKTAELIASEEPRAITSEKNYAPVQLAYYDSLVNVFQGEKSSREYMNLMMWQPYFEAMVESHPVLKTRVPNQLFEGQKLIKGSKREVLLKAMGHGHTESDAVLYLPGEKILFTSDLVFIDMHPYLADGFPVEWVQVLDELIKLKPKTVVPGHGPVGNTDDLETMKTYLNVTENLALQFIKDSGNPKNLDRVEIPDPFSEWWFENFFYTNLKFLYNRIKNN